MGQGSEYSLFALSNVTVNLNVAKTNENPWQAYANEDEEERVGQRLLVIESAELYPLVKPMAAPAEEIWHLK